MMPGDSGVKVPGLEPQQCDLERITEPLCASVFCLVDNNGASLIGR